MALKARGVEVVSGTLEDAKNLDAAFEDAYGVFSVRSSDQRDDRAAHRGIAVAPAAQQAGVSHLVSSVGGADRGTGVAHFESKWRIEQHLRSLGLPVTVVRPVFFMDNVTHGWMRVVLLALMRHYIPAAKPLQMIATADIVDWVAGWFADPDRYIGAAEEIAGDGLTRAQITATLRQAGFRSGPLLPLPGALLRRLPGDLAQMFAWVGQHGYQADIPALRHQQPSLLTLPDGARSAAQNAPEKELS